MFDARRQVDLRTAGLLTSFVFLLNLPVLNAFFVGDDFDFLRLIGRRSLLDNLSFEFWGEWEPVWWASWWLDTVLWGHNPLGFHLQNTLWLAACVVALFWVVRQARPQDPNLAWAVALLFAAHPLHDEAVAYLAARGHVIALALMLLSLGLYAHARQSAAGPQIRRGPLVAALVAGFFAALTKETALVLGVWVGVYEWLLIQRDRPRLQAFTSGVAWGSVFLATGASTLLLRGWVVGLGSSKLEGRFGEWGALIGDTVSGLPAYALLGGLPLPFGMLDEPAVEGFSALGWLLIVAAFGIGGRELYRAATYRGEASRAGLFVFGLVILLSGLAPVFWADLPLRRRYVFLPSVGIVLMIACIWSRVAERVPRAAVAALALAVVACSAVSLQRNDMYRRAGSMARDLIEVSRGAPLGEWTAWQPPVTPLTMPARYGGDSLSGAYVLHHTDMLSAFKVFGVRAQSAVYALRFDHAEAMEIEVFRRSGGADLTVTFLHQRAFDAAMRSDPAERGRGDVMRARRTGVDPEARTMTFAVELDPRLELDRARLPYLNLGRVVPLDYEPAASN